MKITIKKPIHTYRKQTSGYRLREGSEGTEVGGGLGNYCMWNRPKDNIVQQEEQWQYFIVIVNESNL